VRATIQRIHEHIDAGADQVVVHLLADSPLDPPRHDTDYPGLGDTAAAKDAQPG
jgi:hypothetical protein